MQIVETPREIDEKFNGFLRAERLERLCDAFLEIASASEGNKVSSNSLDSAILALGFDKRSLDFSLNEVVAELEGRRG